MYSDMLGIEADFFGKLVAFRTKIRFFGRVAKNPGFRTETFLQSKLQEALTHFALL